MTAKEYILGYGKRAKDSVLGLQSCSAQTRKKVLYDAADLLEKNRETIDEANRRDVAEAQNNGLAASFVDRLVLNDARFEQMVKGIREVAELADDVGKTESVFYGQDGLEIRKISVPLGVIGIIFESRPNVTADAAALCLKSGNVALLRGGKEALASNLAIAEQFRQALRQNGLSENCVQVLDNTDREIATELMRMTEYLDLLIPRGGAGLIRSVVSQAAVPVIETGAGNCHIYVDRDADVKKAVQIVENAKIQKPSACNAVETVLVHTAIADKFLPELYRKMKEDGVECRADEFCRSVVPEFLPATEEDWQTEYNALILAVKSVESEEEALAHIAKYSTKHSEAILTENESAAQLFLQSVDSACVYWNASIRFSDGFEFGLGAEIGISTQKLHARGPMGLKALFTTKYIVVGSGQVRK